jgi:hypothetical protein
LYSGFLWTDQNDLGRNRIKASGRATLFWQAKDVDDMQWNQLRANAAATD